MLPKNEEQSKKNGCEYPSIGIEQLQNMIVEKMNEEFQQRFEQLKDSLLTLMAGKLSTLIEENNTLRSTLQEEVEDLQVRQNGIEQRLQTIESKCQCEKKEMTVMHDLTKTFNRKLTEIETSSENAIQDVNKEVQSIKDNVNKMISEVPQVTSIETRFAAIEERMSNFTEVGSSDFNLSANEDRSCKTSYCQEDIMIAVSNEVDQRQQRRKSLVIHNLEESGDPNIDCLLIREIIQEVTEEENTILDQQLISSYRLGTTAASRSRTIKVHLKSEEFCRRVIQNARNLQNSLKYQNIVIQPDLTPHQRSQLKSLVREKNLRNSYAVQCGEEPDWVIRQGRLYRKYNLRQRTSTTQDT